MYKLYQTIAESYFMPLFSNLLLLRLSGRISGVSKNLITDVLEKQPLHQNHLRLVVNRVVRVALHGG